jgi:hypothetical protein
MPPVSTRRSSPASTRWIRRRRSLPHDQPHKAGRTWQPKPCHMNDLQRGRALSATDSRLGCYDGSREPPTFYWLAWRAIPAAYGSKHDAQIPPTRVRDPWGGGQAVIGPFCGAGQSNCRTCQPTVSDPTTPKNRSNPGDVRPTIPTRQFSRKCYKTESASLSYIHSSNSHLRSDRSGLAAVCLGFFCQTYDR